MKIKIKGLRLLNIIVIIFLITGCQQQTESQTGNSNAFYYTCPMHPSVISNTPGVCPVCNMTLIKVNNKTKSHSEREGNFITIDKHQQILAGIFTDTAKLNVINPVTSLLGKVSLDETQVTSVSSRVSGRIEKLHIKASGEFINKGSPLYEIYSEELLVNEKEFLLLTEKSQQNSGTNNFLDDLLTASRNKLLLWGLTATQLTQLTKSKSPSPQITFYSPVQGYVTDVLINEGMYVETGTPIVKIAFLNQVWVEAQIYSNEKITSKTFKIFSSTATDEFFNGKLVYNNPVLEAGRKFQLLRIKVENTNGKLIPGMMVYVNADQESKPVLSVPKSAVILENMETVWVKVDETTFEQRMVETGKSNDQWVEILSGIKENDIVVNEGAYLINSEFVLKSGSGQAHDH
jgi:membrane fusion protein, copper/silver efflux system